MCLCVRVCVCTMLVRLPVRVCVFKCFSRRRHDRAVLTCQMCVSVLVCILHRQAEEAFHWFT